MRRYLGVNWLSVREVGNRLGWSDELVLACVESLGVRFVWLSVGGRNLVGGACVRPYMLASQVNELELRFRAVEAMDR